MAADAALTLPKSGRGSADLHRAWNTGIIITQHAQLSHYLGMLTHQAAIESKFVNNLIDNLNAEIVLGAHTSCWQRPTQCMSTERLEQARGARTMLRRQAR